jgi:hypothetical protein
MHGTHRQTIIVWVSRDLPWRVYANHLGPINGLVIRLDQPEASLGSNGDLVKLHRISSATPLQSFQ